MDPYSNYLASINPEAISLQINYLRMLANYYKPTEPARLDPEPEENILEKSLNAESIFLQNDISELENISNDICKEVLSFSPPNKNFENDEIFTEPTAKKISKKTNSELLEREGFRDIEEDFIVRQPVKRQISYGNDEQPIKAGGSFEMLLERELKKNESSFSLSDSYQAPPRIKSEKKVLKDLPLKMPDSKGTEKKFEMPKKIESFHLNKSITEDMATPKTNKKEVPPKQNFLKRGEGKLCVDKKIAAKTSSANNSKILFSEKSEVLTEIQFSDKEEDLDKGVYLDEQIKHYTAENAKLQKLIKEVEDKKRRLERERNDFLKEKEKKIEDFEKWKQGEEEKIKKDRTAYEKKLRIQMKEKDEIQELKKQIERLERENKEIKGLFEEEIKRLKLSKISQESSEKYSEEPEESSDKYSDQSEGLEKDDKEKYEDQEKESLEEDLKENESDSDEGSFVTPSAGKKEIVYSNGIRKEIYPDGYSVVYFNNKDVKQCFADGRTVYHYAEAKTVQTTFPDGMQLFKFANGQIEKHFPDGSKEISFQDGTVKCVYPDGQEESVFPDGTVQTVDAKGVKFIEFVNGQKDTIYPNGVKIRKYPDGRVRKIMPDGKIIEQ